MDRRTALRAGGSAAAGAVAATLLGDAAQPASLDDWDWAALVKGLSPGATLYRPGEASFYPLSVPFNHRYADILPVGILTPAIPADIQHAIGWARQRGVPVAPRSSLGHNYAGYSTTSGLLLIMSRMRGIAVSPAGAEPGRQRYGPVEVIDDAGTITVQAGVVNADLAPLLAEDGISIPAGRCPTVGIAGLVLGGGIGFSDKMFGLTCDRLVSTDVVLADGSMITCDEATEPDLFWACRGGAGNNFGVNTSFTFRYEQLRGEVTFFQLRWGIDAAGSAMLALQEVAMAEIENRRYDFRLGMGTSGLTRAEIRRNARVDAIGQFFGAAEELADLLAPVLAVGTPAEQAANRASIREVTPAESARLLSATTPVAQFGAKSAVLTDPLSPRQVDTVATLLLEWPGSRNPDGCGIALFGLGGRINLVPPTATAFVHRDGLFVLAAETAWADDDPPLLGAANVAWLDDFYEAIFRGESPHPAYQNFPDPQLVDWQWAYYGENYPRLVEVKRTYDPGDFFRYGQSIGSGSESSGLR